VLRYEDIDDMRSEILQAVMDDQSVLHELRKDVMPLRDDVQQLRERSTTAISFVATDGGNNAIEFDPFLVHLVRVVDSSNNELLLQALTRGANLNQLSEKLLKDGARNPTGLSKLMRRLGTRSLMELSHMIRVDDSGRAVSPSWVQTYRELHEWAILLDIIESKEFATDTILVVDGFLRTKIFAGALFRNYLDMIDEAAEKHRQKNRGIYIAGIAKKSKVLSRYRLAMALENVLRTNYPAYVAVPRALEEKTYQWSEYARGQDNADPEQEAAKFVGGNMYFVKFGSRPTDPIWPIDVLTSQVRDASKTLGFLLADAKQGFPLPLYPRCLQTAHEYAALVDFDMAILQDMIFDAVRTTIDSPDVLDIFRLEDPDPGAERYRR
jgi:hypothetical protein